MEDQRVLITTMTAGTDAKCIADVPQFTEVPSLSSYIENTCKYVENAFTNLPKCHKLRKAQRLKFLYSWAKPSDTSPFHNNELKTSWNLLTSY